MNLNNWVMEILIYKKYDVQYKKSNILPVLCIYKTPKSAFSGVCTVVGISS